MDTIQYLIDKQNKFFNTIKESKHIICYGAGSKGRQTIQLLKNQGITISAVCDSAQELQGKMIEEIPIMSYEQVVKKFKDYTILITATYKNAHSIKNELIKKGEKNTIIFCSNPFKVEQKFLEIDYIIEHSDDIEICETLLSDNLSKEIFKTFLYWKMTGDTNVVDRYGMGVAKCGYFDDSILPWRYGTYIDIGAYTGDTISKFLAHARGKYTHIYCIEPDEVNYKALEQFIINGAIDNITALKECLWSKVEYRPFYTAESIGLKYESSNCFSATEKQLPLKHKAIMESKAEESYRMIKMNTLDVIFETIKEIELIKLDVLASEIPILQGAREIIIKHKPDIMMEIGTHSKYLLDGILFFYRLGIDYKFYLRQVNYLDNSRTYLYCTNK